MPAGKCFVSNILRVLISNRSPSLRRRRNAEILREKSLMTTIIGDDHARAAFRFSMASSTSAVFL